jgi:HK97 family phage major capsid protein
MTHGVNGSVIGSPPAEGTVGCEFLVDTAAAVPNANFERNAQIMAPRLPQSLAELRDATNQYIAPPTYLDGIPRLQTKQVPDHADRGRLDGLLGGVHRAVDQLWIGIRTTLWILPLRERFIDNGLHAFQSWLRADVQLAHPAAFVVDAGVRS